MNIILRLIILFALLNLIPFTAEAGPTTITLLPDGLNSSISLISDSHNQKKIQRKVPKESYQKELRVLQHIATYNIGPSLIESIPEESTFILNYIPGNTLPAFDETVIDDYLAVVDQLRNLHRVPLLENSQSHLPYDTIFRLYEKIQSKNIPCPRQFEQAVQQIKVIQKALSNCPRKLCHNDFHPKNVVVSSTGSKIIDWSTAENGDPYFDLAKLCISVPELYKEKIVAHYHGGIISQEERAHFYLMEQALLMVIALHRFSNTKGTISSILPPATDFTTYPQTQEEFLLTSLQALNAFLANVSQEKFKKALALYIQP